MSVSLFTVRMNLSFKVDSEVGTNMMTAEFSFSCRSSAFHFTRTYFSINKNENHYDVNYFHLCTGPGVRWVPRLQSQWEKFLFEVWDVSAAPEGGETVLPPGWRPVISQVNSAWGSRTMVGIISNIFISPRCKCSVA